jgi:hypothetical protein
LEVSFKEETMVKLRLIFEESLKQEVEFSGFFDSCDVNGEQVLSVSSAFDHGSGMKGEDWTASVSEDVPFSFHTHPLLFDEGGEYDNFGSSCMLSGEDLMGLVQDSLRNDHFLSNPNGRNVFDVVVSVCGLLVVGAGSEVIRFHCFVVTFCLDVFTDIQDKGLWGNVED